MYIFLTKLHNHQYLINKTFETVFTNFKDNIFLVKQYILQLNINNILGKEKTIGVFHIVCHTDHKEPHPHSPPYKLLRL